MKALAVIALLASAALGQTSTATGTITISAPTPGSVIATAGSITCAFAGNASPATAVTISCTLGTVKVDPYTMPVSNGSAYTFQQNLNGDAITVSFSSTTVPGIVWKAAATPNGGTAATGGNSF
jgi:D-serine deaminase-like pyridoxal phosphate-dependent protein